MFTESLLSQLAENWMITHLCRLDRPNSLVFHLPILMLPNSKRNFTFLVQN